MNNLLLCIFATTLIGCASTGSKFAQSDMQPPPKQMAQIVTYMEPLSFVLIENGETLRIDGDNRCKLVAGTYQVANVTPGKNRMSVPMALTSEDSEYFVSTKPGKRYFVKTVVNREDERAVGVAGALGGALGAVMASEAYEREHKGNFIFKQVDEAVALNDLSTMKRSLSCQTI